MCQCSGMARFCKLADTTWPTDCFIRIFVSIFFKLSGRAQQTFRRAWALLGPHLATPLCQCFACMYSNEKQGVYRIQQNIRVGKLSWLLYKIDICEKTFAVRVQLLAQQHELEHLQSIIDLVIVHLQHNTEHLTITCWHLCCHGRYMVHYRQHCSRPSCL